MKIIKNTALLFLLIIIFEQSFGQINRLDILKMKNICFFKERHCKDTIYYGELRNDSIVEIKRIYTLVENKVYISFINDTVTEIGQFRKYNAISFSKRRYIRMEKKRYWKSYNTKGKIFDLVDNYSQNNYIRIFPCFRYVKKRPR